MAILLTKKKVKRKEKLLFYGPHSCDRGCGALICKVAHAQGGKEYDYPEYVIYPNTVWHPHKCSKHLRTVRKQ